MRELLTPEGLRLLDEVSASGSSRDVLAEVSRLRKAGYSPGLVAAVVTQARLRNKARAKFGEFADRMLFTPAALEQATRLSVAAHHAHRFARARVATVADLGCGIGGDSLALASLDISVRAVEADEVTATLAAFNLAPFPECQVLHARAEDVALDDMDALWCDPARRTSGHASVIRLANPADWSPSLEWVLDQASKKPAGIKLGPGFPLESIPRELGGMPVEAQWVDVGGETVELVLWTLSLARENITRSALVLSKNGFHELTALTESVDATVGELGEYLYEPHGAVIRARLIGDLARTLDAHTLDPRIAYLSSDSLTETPFADAFKVLAVCPLDAKKISAELVSRGIGTLEIKKRGVDLDPGEFRRSLTLRGDGEATLIVLRVGAGSASRRVAVVTQRV